ncbi:GNAT family N-acetyltransferase [Pelagibius litoralis]|uniref:GNAT family N-acetyltransferase n=1 Tax=Pelagibius litoralis TaxID=374515 RepID=UPI002AC32A0D|nr:GNAT family N-acetyltransferase [Pelagibius litoralis]
MEVRNASPCDVALLAALQTACYASDGQPELPEVSFVGQAWSARSWAEVLAMPGSFAFVAAAGESPVGFFLGQVLFEDCELLSLGVLPARRRSGLGRRLLEQGTSMAVQQGANRIQLEVAENNLGAQRFYHSQGFALIGRRAGYYHVPGHASGGPAVDALILERHLMPG